MMTSDEITSLALASGSHGVLFWNSGESLVPQQVAANIAREKADRRGPVSITLDCRELHHRNDATEMLLRDTAALRGGAGDGFVYSSLKSPPSPLFAEFADLVVGTKHEFYDDVRVRHDGFFIVIDTPDLPPIEALAVHHAQANYAKACGLSAARIFTQVEWAASKFLQIERVGDSGFRVRKEPEL